VPFGAFVRLPEENEGLININNFSWLKRVKCPEDFLKKGDEVEAVVLKINPQIEKMLLSLKHVKSPIEALIKNKEISSVRIDKFQSILKEGDELKLK